MKKIVKYIAAASVMFGLASCDDLFEPAIDNIKDEESMESEPNYADAILGSAYILMPYSGSPENDVATDDAVSNDIYNDYLSMAGGSWTARTGVSVNNWRDRNASIQYCNLLLERLDNIKFSEIESVNQMFKDRLYGEAHGLRALNLYYLLQNYGGKAASGELLGVPIWTKPYGPATDNNVKRDSFKDCVAQILKDVDIALEYLPLDYKNLTNDEDVPEKYRSMGASADLYNRVNGETTALRLSGRIAEAIGSQATLLAASPAFNEQSGVSWEDAAKRAAGVLDRIGGVAGMSAKGHLWFTAGEIGNSVKASVNHAEVIWRDGASENSDIEANNFPPSLYGNGRVNPTQNLVDAFPMANGYPISMTEGNYNASDPYANRDPRLDAYIVVNGSKLGVNNSVINTGADATNNDGINKESGKSTRTGYYLRKLLRGDVNPNGTNKVNKYHYTCRIRYTEIFLAYAEAANEAWGPTGTGSNNYSAYDVIKAIRKRAMGDAIGDDPYLESIKSNKDEMRKLIRNERRLELCFENKRFWDLRRWKADLNETANGINGPVEERHFRDYMIYGPLPYNDVLQFSNLEQNMGW